ncbi:hypothetical protein LQE85_12090 [Stenotrophomonas rhizophila]|uniref:hypothetical protein n=1 Tax=Stenotrophomonas rhizophila TaxID=216778 RepID=UPI00201D244A|nr:hypothetical protein [Stenotrophomonas rhizophila]UQY86238.1 hypothetical protein LQE85_12090 [Stenotrophomonas rhizophila]
MRLIASLRRIVSRISNGESHNQQISSQVRNDLDGLDSRISELKIRMDALEGIPDKVQAIEARLKDSFLAKLHFGANPFSVMVVLLFISILASIIAVGVKWDFIRLMDLMAYLFPILAGFFAGLGLYLREPDLGSVESRPIITEASCFKVSVLFLFLGIISYFLSKDLFHDVVLSAFGLLGSAVSLFSVIINSGRMNEGPTSADKAFKPIVRLIFTLNLLASIGWALILITRFDWT